MLFSAIVIFDAVPDPVPAMFLSLSYSYQQTHPVGSRMHEDLKIIRNDSTEPTMSRSA